MNMWHRYTGFVAAHQTLLAAHRAFVPSGARMGTLGAFGGTEDYCRKHGGDVTRTPDGRLCCRLPGMDYFACVEDTLPAPIALSWIAASPSSAKPSNADDEWIEITHAPGQGPTINGKPTQQGRGTLHRSDGSADFVVVFGVKQDHPSGWLAAIRIYEDMAMPQCPASQAIYSRSTSGNWPSGHTQQYLCGIPRGEKGDLDIFRLPTTVSPDPGAPVPPDFSGIMVKEPAGKWLSATFFDVPPRRHRLGAQWWVQIKTPPGYQGSRFGHGLLHHGDKHKDVLIVEIGGTQQQPQARFVPNDASFFTNEPDSSGDSAPLSRPGADVGIAPLSIPNPPRKRMIIRR